VPISKQRCYYRVMTKVLAHLRHGAAGASRSHRSGFDGSRRAANDGRPQLEIVTLSNRADLIIGGDVLVEVSVPRDASISRVKVKLNGRDIKSSSRQVRHDERSAAW
jgi:hypothetical protein